MGFLTGRLTCDRFQINAAEPARLGPEHLEVLEKFAIGKIETAGVDEAELGFLAGQHLFDVDFQLDKNIIHEALHAAIRVDVTQIPAALRQAWLTIELAALAANNPSGRPTKAQKQEAREAVAARCADEAKSGQYRRMKQFPFLWNGRENRLYVGTGGTGADRGVELIARAFELECERLTAGKLATRWAAAARRKTALANLCPSSFHDDADDTPVAWVPDEAGNIDYLGNEFLLWLWWHWETQSETITLSDDSQVTGMLCKTLSLECPKGESGKETISAEMPVKLPEARQAIRCGKLPRKSGIRLSRHGADYEFVLQAETFSISGARIDAGEESRGRGVQEDRIEAVRVFGETLDLLYEAFCERRIGADWDTDLDQIRRWIHKEPRAARPSAA